MSDPLQAVLPGTPLLDVVTADRMNALSESARRERLSRERTTPGTTSQRHPDSITLRVRNTTGSTFPVGTAVQISDPISPPESSLEVWQQGRTYGGILPTGINVIYGITEEPILASGVGRVVVAGIVPATLNIIDAADTHAGTVAGSGELNTSVRGQARILWKESGTGSGKRGVVQLLTSRTIHNGGELGGGPTDSSDPEPALTLTCNVFRPFGSATLVGPADQPCGIVADFARGRLAAKAVDWTHYLVCDADDIQDGNSLGGGANTLTYGDGDEVQITIGTAVYSFVVTWVGGEAEGGEKCYLLRHTVTYSGDPLELEDRETWTWDFEVVREGDTVATGLGRLVNDWVRCRIAGDTPEWTHFLECNADTDIQDGCTRSLGSAALTYGVGDQVLIGDGEYDVVWVEVVNAGTSECYKRVFLMRKVQDPHNNGECGPGGFWGMPDVVDYGVV